INNKSPCLYLGFDATDSRAIENELPDAERKVIEAAVEYKPVVRAPRERKVSTADEQPIGDPSRMDYVGALLRTKNDNLLAKLTNDKDVQIEAYVFDGDSTSRLRKLELNR